MKIKLYDNFKQWLERNLASGVVWVIGDLHFNDPDCKLINPNWPTVDEQIKLINSKVGKHDTLVILGDVGDTGPVKKLKGYKVLIKGNHDKGNSKYERNEYTVDCYGGYIDESDYFKKLPDFIRFSGKERLKRVAYYDNRLFDEVYDGPVFISNKILLSHEPIKLEFGYNIHGHCHQGEKFKYWANDCVQINVCSDVVNFEPQRLDKIIEGYKVKDIHRLTIEKRN